MKNWVLKSFAKIIGKHLCQSHFFNKVAYYERYLGMAASALITRIFILTPCRVSYFLYGVERGWRESDISGLV